jgi:hypothetical protein
MQMMITVTIRIINPTQNIPLPPNTNGGDRMGRAQNEVHAVPLGVHHKKSLSAAHHDEHDSNQDSPLTHKSGSKFSALP